jgi:hypothetical protein
VTYIGRIPFYGTGITEITVPASLSSVGSATLQLGGGPFGGMSNLKKIVIKHGMESLPANIFYCVGAYSTAIIHVPMSIASGADTAGMTGVDSSTGIDLSRGITVQGVKGSYIVAWAEENGIKCEEVDGEIKDPAIESAWLNVPYQYIIETGTYENIGLDFKVVDKTKLPAGLELLPDGRFHGAPLKTGTFTFVVEVRYPEYGYLLDRQSIELTVEAPVGYPGDIELFESNDYPISDFIGESTGDVGGVPVGYVLTLLRSDEDDTIFRFRVADTDINDDGLIDAADSNFPYFTDFWLDGEKLTSASAISGGDYGAHEGSTVVTVYAKTFQNLNNGNHTVAAEFMIPTREGDPPIQKVAAQKFTLELIDPEPDPEPEPNNDPDPEQKPDPEPEPNTDPEPEPNPGSVPDPEQPNRDDDIPGGQETNNGLPAGIPRAVNTATTPARSGSDSGAPAVLTATETADAADETPAAPVIAPATPAIVAEDTGAAGADTNPAGITGAVAIDGLPRDANGLFYFVLDGSGAPLEARLDVPLADFADMYFDGELWTLGADYDTREGSTILVITAERLMDFAYGTHEIDARFKEDLKVAFTFDLRGPAPANDPEAPAENTALEPGSPVTGLPGAPFLKAALAIVLLTAAALVLRARRAG